MKVYLQDEIYTQSPAINPAVMMLRLLSFFFERTILDIQLRNMSQGKIKKREQGNSTA